MYANPSEAQMRIASWKVSGRASSGRSVCQSGRFVAVRTVSARPWRGAEGLGAGPQLWESEM